MTRPPVVSELMRLENYGEPCAQARRRATGYCGGTLSPKRILNNKLNTYCYGQIALEGRASLRLSWGGWSLKLIHAEGHRHERSSCVSEVIPNGGGAISAGLGVSRMSLRRGSRCQVCSPARLVSVAAQPASASAARNISRQLRPVSLRAGTPAAPSLARQAGR